MSNFKKIVIGAAVGAMTVKVASDVHKNMQRYKDRKFIVRLLKGTGDEALLIARKEWAFVVGVVLATSCSIDYIYTKVRDTK